MTTPPELDGLPVYVQVAARAVFDGQSLTLVDLAPATVFAIVGLTPSVGQLPTGVFLDHWYGDATGPGTRFVAAVLSTLDPGRPSESLTELLVGLPRIRGTGLEYQVQAVAGDLPETTGACVLFIRPPVSPVTPADAAGSPLHGLAPTRTP